jgi:hypothetical protein
MLGGNQEAEVDFVAHNPGARLFHRHQQLHMDFGFITLFDYVQATCNKHSWTIVNLIGCRHPELRFSWNPRNAT